MGTIRVDKQRVKVLMAIRGIDNYQDLATKTGMHYNNLLRMVNTGRFSVDSLEQLANALSVNPIDLIVTPGYPDPNLEPLARILAAA